MIINRRYRYVACRVFRAADSVQALEFQLPVPILGILPPPSSTTNQHQKSTPKINTKNQHQK